MDQADHSSNNMFAVTSFVVPGAFATQIASINDRGEMTGTFANDHFRGPHGFIYDGGSLITLDPPGSLSTLPSKINSRGEIAGTYNDGVTNHGFLYNSGTFSQLDAPGSTETIASDLNNRSQVVGYYMDANNK